MSRYRTFDRAPLELLSIDQRGHDLTVDQVRPLESPDEPLMDPGLRALVRAIVGARQRQRPVILMMGAHPIKLGLSRFLIDMMSRGWVTHLAVNGAGIIHDFELATVGGTSENVARWIQAGQFGLWQQSGVLNDVIRQSAERREGLGEGVGRWLLEQHVPQPEISLAAQAWRHGIPLTCHVGIGSDIIHAHANCDGAALGTASYTDFLIFAASIQELEGGVYLNIGSAVTGPEVYLKALSMARNVARQQQAEIRRFTTGVFDLIPVPTGYQIGPPAKDHPMYYYRPWKTILVRTVADGGASHYVCGDHQSTIPSLWHHLAQAAQTQPVVPPAHVRWSA